MRGFKSFSSIAFMTLVIFSSSEAVFRPAAFAAAPVTGVIQSIKPLDDGRYELTVQGAEGEIFVINTSTQIEGMISAKEVKQGQRIVLPGADQSGGIRGMTPMSNPFGNMSDSMKKQLGLPDMPDVPEVPGVPEVPALPQLPDLPQLPQASDSALPDLPSLPGGSAGGGPAGAPAGGGGVPAGGGGGMPGGLGDMMNQGGGEKVEHEAEPLPPPEEMLGPKAPVLSAPEQTAGEEPKTVLETRETEGGIEIGFEGEEKVVLPADASVKQLLAPSDLRESMNVIFTAEEMNGEKVVQRLQVV